MPNATDAANLPSCHMVQVRMQLALRDWGWPMLRFDSGSYSDAECEAELDLLFPSGLASPDVLREIAPAGWENSPLLAVFHPTAQQEYEEAVRMHRNLREFSRRRGRAGDLSAEPRFEEIAEAFRSKPVEVEREVRELVGQCLWDIFSDEHDVVAPDGRVLHFGSFRGAGGFLAGWLNRRTGERRYDYLHFYLGTSWVNDRADLSPVYRMIFHRLKRRGLDWVYQFPQVHLIDFRPLRDALEKKEGPDWANYSPSEGLAREEEERRREKEIEEMRENLAQGHREAIEEARQAPPPRIVQAYYDVYGRWPGGWPPC
jgi:hypothetical protein